MKKIKIFAAGIIAAASLGAVNAQVKDVSVTVSPLIEYQWWNRNINLEDNMFYGVRAGFGFGQFFELRAIAEKSLDLKGKLKSTNWNISKDLMEKVPSQTVDITRVGGEAKLNLLDGFGLAPYVTAGAGVQYFKYDPFEEGKDAAKYKEQQIYASFGAGVKFNVSDRAVVSLEAKDVLFNMDETNVYFNPATHDKSKRLHNWAALASLDFYLGGNPLPDGASSLQRSLHDAYTSGFAYGLKFVVEPGLAYVDFKDSKRFADQWFMGGSAGFDFSSLVGIRAFYYQATKDPKKLDFKFNKSLKMYGANFIARLNQPRGIVPYLNFGAGYIDTNEDFKPIKAIKDDKIDKKNLFAMLGGGVEIPVSPWVAVYGTANAMLMAEPGVSPEDLMTPSEVHTNLMYTAGVRFNLGARKNASNILSNYNERNNERINELKSEYQQKIDKLNKELDEAVKNNDRERVDMLLRERSRVNNESSSYEKSENNGSNHNMMTAEEFEALVERVVEKVRKENKVNSASLSDNEMSVVLAALNNQGNANVGNNNQDTQQILNEIRALTAKMDRNYDVMLRSSNNGGTTTIVTPSQPQTEVVPVNPYNNVPNQYANPYNNNEKNVDEQVKPVVRTEDPVVYNENAGTKVDFLKMNRLSTFTGFNFGEGFTWNIGLRGYLQVSNTNWDFMPELYVGMGSKTGYGVSANMVYNFNFSRGQIVKPYLGFGLGVFNQGDEANAGSNLIIGTSLKVLDGNLFVDYSARNLFKNNQIAVGYRFVF